MVGGFGDPLERDIELVREDVGDGFISLEAARDIYKVVINTQPKLYEVDYSATEKLRTDAKKREKGIDLPLKNGSSSGVRLE